MPAEEKALSRSMAAPASVVTAAASMATVVFASSVLSAAASTAASSADDTGDGATPAVSASAEIGAHSSGAEAGTLRLDDFVRLYTNHRPLYSVGLDDVQRAFLRLGCDSVTGKLSWSTLKAALCHEGEPMHEEELAACMYNLIGVEDAKLPPLDSEQFASAVLGFEVLP